MGTGYTIGGDTWQNFGWDKYAGQTFHVQAKVTLTLIKLYLAKPDPRWAIAVLIYPADGYHRPFGVNLSKCMIQAKDFPEGKEEAWITKELWTPINAIPEEYFAIILNGGRPFDDTEYWAYDAGDASYPYGHRIFSPDKGSNWTDHYGDDHLFYIWGTPPAPPPPPPPDPEKWAPLGLKQTLFPGGYIITLTTESPCHLTLLWSWLPPWVHRTAAVRRGLPYLWEGYWCFVVWYEIEQHEPGDTLIHTFTWPGWEVCQTKWFRFKGTIGEEPSISDSPIFEKHYTGYPHQPVLFTEPWSWNGSPVPEFSPVFTEPWTV